MTRQTRIGLAVCIAVLLTFSAGLLWRDYARSHELYAAQVQNDDMRIQIRSMMANDFFGAPYVPSFNLNDLNKQAVSWPEQTGKYRLLVFFSSSDCGSCLMKVSEIGEYGWDGVPVIGIVDGDMEDMDRVRTAIDEYGLRFPVYAGREMPFQLKNTPYVALVSQNRTVLYLDVVGVGTLPHIVKDIQDLFDRNRL